MQIFLGGYRFPANGCHWLVREIPMLQNGVRYARQLVVTVVGRFLGDGTAQSLSTQIGTLRNACLQVGAPLGLIDNTGATVELVGSSGALVPLQVAAGPAFESLRPGEYCMERAFSVQFSAVLPSGPDGLVVVELQNGVKLEGTADGANSTVVWLPSLTGPRQKQTPEPSIPWTLNQYGSCTTRNLPYPMPSPLFRPSALVKPLTLDDLQDRMTSTGIEYIRTWRYVYQDTTPL